MQKTTDTLQSSDSFLLAEEMSKNDTDIISGSSHTYYPFKSQRVETFK